MVMKRLLPSVTARPCCAQDGHAKWPCETPSERLVHGGGPASGLVLAVANMNDPENFLVAKQVLKQMLTRGTAVDCVIYDKMRVCMKAITKTKSSHRSGIGASIAFMRQATLPTVLAVHSTIRTWAAGFVTSIHRSPNRPSRGSAAMLHHSTPSHRRPASSMCSST